MIKDHTFISQLNRDSTGLSSDPSHYLARISLVLAPHVAVSFRGTGRCCCQRYFGKALRYMYDVYTEGVIAADDFGRLWEYVW